ncbi:hypothetical protein CNR22_11220 [Sphingobacteriaceae bacterium]|nr:hypothetical protein CNR22_11220 [Sphingobacteriaceae bacterium]
MILNKGFAQDVEQTLRNVKNIPNEVPLSVTGSIAANMVFYKADGIAPRRDPFYWTLNANLNLTLFNKVNVPFTAVITQQDKNYSSGLDKFSQPFNQFGISPQYRWITVHAGFRSLEFSEYTLSGAMFLGGGLEVKPKKYLVSGAGFYGRFEKAIPKGGVDGIVVSMPAYERWGGGGKIKVGSENNYGEFIFLKIQDNIHSLAFDTSLNVTPQENQIFALGTKQKITKFISVNGHLAYSLYTKNLFDELYKIERFTYINQIYSPRTSSHYDKAITAGIDFTPGKYLLGFKYKRIDPDYKTLGAIFLTNDIEEFSLNTNFSLLKNKISISAASGVQKNNLDKIQVMTSQRIIGSLNVSCNITSNLNLSANYSNFSSNTLPVRDVFTDSIKFVQLTQNEGLNASYAFGKKKIKHTLSNSATYQESGGNKQGLTTFFNETFSYTANLIDLGFGLTVAGLYNKATSQGQGVNEGYGPNFGIQKSLFKNKIRLQLNAGFQNTFIDGEILNKNQTYAFNFSFTLDKCQSLKANYSYLKKNAVKQTAQQFSEMRASLSYVYNFGVTLKKRAK